MLKKKHLVPGSMPRIVCYDNNCGLYKWCAAREQQGEALHLDIGLPVDVFHWTCKHKHSDVACSDWCNPYNYPQLWDQETGEWWFNSSIAEQNNVWIGGYRSILRGMSATHYNFLLDELIMNCNEMRREQLMLEGYAPAMLPAEFFAMNADAE